MRSRSAVTIAKGTIVEAVDKEGGVSKRWRAERQIDANTWEWVSESGKVCWSHHLMILRVVE